ncbi:MAG: hypothetical protein PHS92_00980 [Candidatus Gracilibacteria bacterium]|nr:hypothetical protein [Candidatus Gracilibacteria bacterium]
MKETLPEYILDGSENQYKSIKGLINSYSMARSDINSVIGNVDKNVWNEESEEDKLKYSIATNHAEEIKKELTNLLCNINPVILKLLREIFKKENDTKNGRNIFWPEIEKIFSAAYIGNTAGIHKEKSLVLVDRGTSEIENNEKKPERADLLNNLLLSLDLMILELKDRGSEIPELEEFMIEILKSGNIDYEFGDKINLYSFAQSIDLPHIIDLIDEFKRNLKQN